MTIERRSNGGEEVLRPFSVCLRSAIPNLTISYPMRNPLRQHNDDRRLVVLLYSPRIGIGVPMVAIF